MPNEGIVAAAARRADKPRAHTSPFREEPRSPEFELPFDVAVRLSEQIPELERLLRLRQDLLAIKNQFGGNKEPK